MPNSRAYADAEYSGKFTLRLPRSLHGSLSERARREGIRLNQRVIAMVSFVSGADWYRRNRASSRAVAYSTQEPVSGQSIAEHPCAAVHRAPCLRSCRRASTTTTSGGGIRGDQGWRCLACRSIQSLVFLVGGTPRGIVRVVVCIRHDRPSVDERRQSGS
ncbi:MAG: toxin-antitoxin system HicB family antitoxin [Bacillota bacterium]